jgi:hypothetical protein
MSKKQLCHLYYYHTLSKHTQPLLEQFDSVSIDIKTTSKAIEADFYVVELQEISNDISKIVQNIFSHIDYPVIYFDIPKKHSFLHIQLAVFLKSKFILSPMHDTSKVIKKIKQDIVLYQKEHSFKEIANYLGLNEIYFIVENKKITYASEKLFMEFGSICTSLSDIYQNVFKQINLKSKTQTIDGKNYTLDKIKLSGKNFFLLSKMSNKITSDLKLFSTRVKFMETLKNKLLHNGTKDNKLSLITLNIKETEEASVLVDISRLMKGSTEKKIEVYSYDKGFYIALYEDTHIDKIINFAKQLNVELYTLKKAKNLDMIIEICTLNLEYLEVNDILQKLNYLSHGDVDQEKLLDGKVFLISGMKEGLSDKVIMNNILDVISINKIKFNLFNIYKGLVINNPSWLVSYDGKTIKLQLDKLQSKLIGAQRKSIINIPMFSQTIDISLVEIDKRTNIAIFENLKISKENTCQREHGRVEPDAKTSIDIALKGAKLKGTIIDLSIKSIAIRVANNDIVKSLKDKDVFLSCKLNDSKDSEAYHFQQDAKVISVLFEDANSIKIVCYLSSEVQSQVILTEYVYKRQKGILKEIMDLSF